MTIDISVTYDLSHYETLSSSSFTRSIGPSIKDTTSPVAPPHRAYCKYVRRLVGLLVCRIMKLTNYNNRRNIVQYYLNFCFIINIHNYFYILVNMSYTSLTVEKRNQPEVRL